MDDHHPWLHHKIEKKEKKEKKKEKLKRKAHDANPKPRCKLGFNLRSNSRIQFAFRV
jgi:NADH:ubiquinone oxidoreductase subunit